MWPLAIDLPLEPKGELAVALKSIVDQAMLIANAPLIPKLDAASARERSSMGPSAMGPVQGVPRVGSASGPAGWHPIRDAPVDKVAFLVWGDLDAADDAAREQ